MRLDERQFDSPFRGHSLISLKVSSHYETPTKKQQLYTSLAPAVPLPPCHVRSSAHWRPQATIDRWLKKPGARLEPCIQAHTVAENNTKAVLRMKLGKSQSVKGAKNRNCYGV